MSYSPADRISAALQALILALAPTVAAAAVPQQAAKQRPVRPRAAAEGEPARRAVLMLAPSRVETVRGAPVRLTLSVLGAEELQRLPVTVRFDPRVLELTSVRLGSDWDESNRPVFLTDASRPGELVVGLAALEPKTDVIAGTAELLELEFRTLRAGEVDVELERFALIGASASGQPVVGRNASIRIR